ncbi:MAG: hypothetical protein E6Q67_04985 [Roseateles sp.]|nr:MAG: hypothetical protein E6Q67_04985 [Roseateles sp.]
MGDQHHDSHAVPEPDGESCPWLAMARELAANPDSPASLRILSSVNASLRPRMAAVEQLLDALVAQLERPGPVADASVAAASRHWEVACDGELTAGILEDLKRDAAAIVDRMRSSPPPIESILADVCGRSDIGYDLGLDLEGLRGTWHRLWAAISMARVFGESPEQVDCVASFRAEVERQLGRVITESEWQQLQQHAFRHGDALAERQFGGRQG